jgi:hypothetical protein
MAAVERDPLREIRKGKIVIEQRREFGDVARSSPPANNKRRTLRLEGKSPKGGSNHSNELSVSRLAPYPLHLTVPTDDCGQTNWVPTELGCGNAETASLTCAR